MVKIISDPSRVDGRDHQYFVYVRVGEDTWTWQAAYSSASYNVGTQVLLEDGRDAVIDMIV